jgi:hypothetical protein
MLVLRVEPVTNFFKLGTDGSWTRYRGLEWLGIEPATNLNPQSTFLKLEVTGS